MAVTLIVEDGTIVENANTYNDLATLKTFLEGHPYGAATLALDDDTLSRGLIQSFRELNAAATWKGDLVEWDQEGAFPRSGLDPVPDDVVPKQVKAAQLEFVRFVLASDRSSEADGAAVKREKVDVLEIEYQVGAKRDVVPEIVQRLIKPFVLEIADDAGGAGSLPTSSVVAVSRA